MSLAKIRKIYSQESNGNGTYLLDSYGIEDIVTCKIKDAYIGMEVEVNMVDGHMQFVGATTKSQGIANFLIDYVKGIGPAKAYNATWECYNYIVAGDNKTLAETLGINEVKAQEIIDICKENKVIFDAYLVTNGACTKNKIEKICETYGSKAISILRNNPYKLTEMNGIGFLEADKIACACGIAKNSKERILNAIDYILFTEAYQNGHCYLLEEQVREKLLSVLVDMPKSIGKAKETACSNALAKWDEKRKAFIKAYHPTDEEILIMDGTAIQIKSIKESMDNAFVDGAKSGAFVCEDGRYYNNSIYMQESVSADIVKEILNRNGACFTPEEIKTAIAMVEDRKTKENSDGKRFECTEEQISAVNLSLSHTLSVISGGPGRGKTAIAEIIAQAFANKYGKESVIMLAPTGCAAKRMTESTGYHASTIHRAIITSKVKDKLIIVDEGSMVDISLFYKFLKWGKDNVIVILGDVNQIASVGPGKVLADLIKSNVVPYIILKKGHRNSGSISQNSELINNGEPTWTYKMDDAFKYVPSAKDNIVKTFLKEYYKTIKKYGVAGTMVIAPSRVGSAGVNFLNKTIQEQLNKSNPFIDVAEGVRFYVGDRVMHTKNDLSFVLKNPDGSETMGIFNGEKGTVISVCEKGLVVQFDDGRVGAYKKESAIKLTLCFVITIHKCQGSEAPGVIVLMTFQDAFLINRNLFYTAVTRAKKEVELIGEQKKSQNQKYLINAFNVAVRKTNDANRQTTLAQKILG